MSSANLNRYIKEYLKRQPKTLSMSQIEELIEYDAWLDTQSGITKRAADLPTGFPKNWCFKCKTVHVGECADTTASQYR